MVTVNTSVFCSSSKSTVLPWTIVQLKEESHTFQDFFDTTIKPRLSIHVCTLLSALVGPEKSSLDPVDTSIQVLPVINSFGKFLKYCIDADAEELNDLETQCSDSADTSHNLTLGFLAPMRARNKKDELYNDLIALFVSCGALLYEAEIKSYGKKLVTTLRDVLWHIDGHHAILAKRAFSIPLIFKKFVNYNVPELSKHRKRRTCNISSAQLQSFVEDLLVILEYSHWERPQWKTIKPSITELCNGLASYIEYLSQKNKRAKLNHRSPTPVREISDNLKISFVDCIDKDDVAPVLKPIDDLLVNESPYVPISLLEYTPNDPVKKYRFVNLLESSGLSIPFILLKFNPGSNIGKLLFIWKVPEGKDFGNYLQESQQAIEEVRKCIPVFHTRAMKSALFSKFGRLTSNVKPAVLRHFYRELTGEFIMSTCMYTSRL